MKAMFLEKNAEDMAIFIAASKALGIEPEIVVREENIGETVKKQRPDAIFINCQDFNVSITQDIKETSPNSLIYLVDANESQEILGKEFGTLQTLNKNDVITMLKLIRKSCLPKNSTLLQQKQLTRNRFRKQESILKVMFLGKNSEDMLIFDAAAIALGMASQVMMCENEAAELAGEWSPDVVFVDDFDFSPRIIMDIKEACPHTAIVAINCSENKKDFAKEFGTLAILESHKVTDMLKTIRRKLINKEDIFS